MREKETNKITNYLLNRSLVYVIDKHDNWAVWGGWCLTPPCPLLLETHGCSAVLFPVLSFLIPKHVCCCGTRVTLWLVLGYPGVNSFRGGQTNKQTTKLIFKTFDMAVTPVTYNNRQKCLHSELSSESSFYLFFFSSVTWSPSSDSHSLCFFAQSMYSM